MYSFYSFIIVNRYYGCLFVTKGGSEFLLNYFAKKQQNCVIVTHDPIHQHCNNLKTIKGNDGNVMGYLWVELSLIHI